MRISPRISEFLATGFYISYVPYRVTGFKKFTGSGFAGTVVALLLAVFLPENAWLYALLLALFIPFSMLIADETEKFYGTHDDPRIVIDEIAGYWVAIAFLPRTMGALLAAFVFFRALDTVKPWPIRTVERISRGGFGIIIDDVLAGVGANLLTRLALKFL